MQTGVRADRCVWGEVCVRTSEGACVGRGVRSDRWRCGRQRYACSEEGECVRGMRANMRVVGKQQNCACVNEVRVQAGEGVGEMCECSDVKVRVCVRCACNFVPSGEGLRDQEKRVPGEGACVVHVRVW